MVLRERDRCNAPSGSASAQKRAGIAKPCDGQETSCQKRHNHRAPIDRSTSVKFPADDLKLTGRAHSIQVSVLGQKLFVQLLRLPG